MATGSKHYIQAFFARYPSFDYDIAAPFFDEFQRLGKASRWKKPQWDQKRDELRGAMVKQFNAMYGTSADDLESWRLLCSALGMDPVPDDIKTCQQKVKSTHVNLVDFVEAPLSGRAVNRFKTETELSRYTKETKKYFPRHDVNAGSLLRYLLRQILRPNSRLPRPPLDAKKQKTRRVRAAK
ncbi:hypothetical protein GY45DRAFT_1039697 [Cubamyces sp. BRFM 1775]|nr:hypothetical protein GY45DRAFT_1039697 [Cubamyces sp. BRFM 1775]